MFHKECQTTMNAPMMSKTLKQSKLYENSTKNSELNEEDRLSFKAKKADRNISTAEQYGGGKKNMRKSVSKDLANLTSKRYDQSEIISLNKVKISSQVEHIETEDVFDDGGINRAATAAPRRTVFQNSKQNSSAHRPLYSIVKSQITSSQLSQKEEESEQARKDVNAKL